MTTNRLNDKRNSSKINAIRMSARDRLGMEDLCPTCRRSKSEPYQRKDTEGRAFEGCVDAFHHGHVASYLADWFYRPVAREIRATELRHLESL